MQTQINTYRRLDRYLCAFAEGHLNLLWIVGPPGTQKTRGLRHALRGAGRWIQGSVTAFGMFRELWEGRDQPIVIDDVDDIYRDKAAVNLLKTLCQTDERKVLGWHTDNSTLKKEQIPRRFSTRSKVCLISNELQVTNENVAALLDRGHVVNFSPTATEVHHRTAEWFWDQDLFDFIGQRLSWIEQPSMRHYHLSSELKEAGLDWQTFLLSECWGLTGNRLVVAKLQAREDLTHPERLRIFNEETNEDAQVYSEEAYALGYRRA